MKQTLSFLGTESWLSSVERRVKPINQNTQPLLAVEYGGGSIMLWVCISANGPGNLVKVEGIMRKEQYIKILEENLKQAAENLNLLDLSAGQ